MAKKSFPLTDPTGEKQEKRKRGRPRKNQVIDTAKSGLDKAKNVISGASDRIADTTGKIVDTAQSVGNSIDRLSSNFQGSDLSKTGSDELSKKAQTIAQQYGLQPYDVKSKLPTDPYKAPEGEGMSRKEADAEVLKFLRLQNRERVYGAGQDYTGVVLDNAKKNVQNIGKSLDLDTEHVKTGRKMVSNQTERTYLKTDQSKLRTAEELYQQQLIIEGGTILQTNEIRIEQQRKYELQQAKNTKLLIQIEKAHSEIEFASAEQIEAYLED